MTVNSTNTGHSSPDSVPSLTVCAQTPTFEVRVIAKLEAKVAEMDRRLMTYMHIPLVQEQIRAEKEALFKAIAIVKETACEQV